MVLTTFSAARICPSIEQASYLPLEYVDVFSSSGLDGCFVSCVVLYKCWMPCEPVEDIEFIPADSPSNTLSIAYSQVTKKTLLDQTIMLLNGQVGVVLMLTIIPQKEN